VNSVNFPPLAAETKTRLTVALSGTGSVAIPTSTPCPRLFPEAGIPDPVIDPTPLLLFATKHTDPCTENTPKGVVTLQGLDTSFTWNEAETPVQPVVHAAVPDPLHVPEISVVGVDVPPEPAVPFELHPATTVIATRSNIHNPRISSPFSELTRLPETVELPSNPA
jgi:hypothetical protein